MIVDIYMPELDGLEVIQRMRQIAPATRILAVSGDVIRGSAHERPRDVRILGCG